MQIDHVHFYVEDLGHWQDWFDRCLGFQVVQAALPRDSVTYSATVIAGTIRLQLSQPSSSNCPVADYLAQHPPGVADLAFRVSNIEAILCQATQLKAKIWRSLTWIVDQTGPYKTACIQGWGALRHTLIERSPLDTTWGDGAMIDTPDWLGIDHVVLNVERGDLERAVSWYERLFGFQRRQNFAIQTSHSALCSQVLFHPKSGFQLPINEPASASSQIQEFLDWNRGPGIQHIALRVSQILPLIARLRQNGIAFLPVPKNYYSQLGQRRGFALEASEQEAIAQQEVLVDWRLDCPDALLLQAFTQPIFEQPTFFFELIERRTCLSSQRLAEGFGEGNFRALFEAIEREQIKRGSLKG